MSLNERPSPDRHELRPSWELLALMRFLLAMIVVAGHLLWYQGPPIAWAQAIDSFGGKAAVIGFLLISGFSIAASQSRRPAYYLRRRILRIYPLYFVALLFAVLLELCLGTVFVPKEAIPARGWPTIIGNFALLQTFVVKPVAFNGPVWSLSIEFSFYVCAILFARLSPKWLWAITAFSAICFLLPQRQDLGLVYFVLSKLNAIRYLWCWLLGYLMFSHRSWAAMLTLMAGVVLVHVFPATPEPLAELTYVLVALVLCCCDKVRIEGAAAKAMNVLGDLSYAIYLFHFPTFIFAYEVLGIRDSSVLLVLGLAVSGVAYVLIERVLKKRYLAHLVPSEKSGLTTQAQRAAA